MQDIYSVWNWKKGRYDYYRSNAARPYRAAIGYPPPRDRKAVGAVPEESVNEPPAGSIFIGEGDQAIGVIAQPKTRSRLAFVFSAVVALWLLR